MNNLTKLAALAFSGLILSTGAAMADDCHFHWVVGQGFTLECNGNSVTFPGFGGGGGGGATPPTVCFFDQPGYAGAASCVPAGTRDGNVAGFWNDRASSIKLFGGARVRLFVDHGFCGGANVFANDVAVLGAMLNNQASSYQTWAGATPAVPPCDSGGSPGGGSPGGGGDPVPHTMSTGLVTVAAGFWADLETGAVGAVMPLVHPSADFYYERVDAMHNYLKPIHGAQFARGDMSNRGYAGCAVASYSTTHIPLPAMPAGAYICVRTDDGRVSQFRVNAHHPGSVDLGYTTWSN
ncbi:MAG: hypothetical protein KKH72_07210 [Alphaproteobacteria bacterium]|nr:hypothetical protein [Alphaproteobacteria bacterium]